MADRDKEYIGSPLSDENYQKDEDRKNDGNQEANQQSGLGGEQEPGQQEVEGDPGARQPAGGHGDKDKEKGGPSL